MEKILDRAPSYFFLTFALIFSLLKSKNFLPYGRFWAEEGVYFYTEICTQNFPSGLFFIFNNHLELFANIGVYFSTIASPLYAPMFTTIFSVIIWLYVFQFIFHNRRELGLEAWHVYAIFMASIGIPQSSEVWANTINLHFLFLLLGAVILILPAPKGGRTLHSALLVFFCGLSGIPANFIAPLYILSAVLERTWGRALQSAAIVATCLIQILILYKSGYSNERGLSLDLDIIVLASFTQSFWGLFFGAPGGQMAASAFSGFYGGNLIWLLGGASILIISIALGYKTFFLKNNFSLTEENGLRNLKLILSVAICLTASITLSLGDKQELISRADGGRYFWAPNMLLLVIFFSHRSLSSALRNFLIFSLFLFSLLGSFKNFEGPDWVSQLTTIPSEVSEVNTFLIWPNGWSMQVPPRCL